MKNKKQITLALLLLLLPSFMMAQLQRSQSFKNDYKLKEVVILSRHNIRSPLSTNGSELSKLTPHEWTNWTSAASELTLRGGVLETMMGQYFRKWTVGENLFNENSNATADEVNFYANSMQRTIATAQYFASGFMPVANIRINHRYSPSKMDPVFCPRLTKVSDSFKKEALREIAAMGGKKGIIGINEKLKDSYDITAKVLDLKNSPACKSGSTCAFDDYNTQFIFNLNDEPKMKGTLKLANSASDAFVLQYYEEPDIKKAAFGHEITYNDWERIAKIKDVYGDVLFTAPIVSVNVAHPLLVYIHDELNSDCRKFTFLCGHDSNIASVDAALGVENYELPNSIEKKTPIGSKVVFEKWIDKAGNTYVAVNMVYLSSEQLRNLQMITTENPPMIYPLKLKGITPNADGLYSLEDVNKKFNDAIQAYDNIK
jgi:glucose-1-phosphatase